MIPFFLSVFVSAILLGLALFVTRQRLARQFEDIQRRQLEVERTVAAIKTEMERSTTDAQLRRLHLGQVRIQEKIARRYGPLLQAAQRRKVSEFQSSSLQHWAAVFGIELDVRKVVELAEVVDRTEIQGAEDVPVATPDLLAMVIALLGMARQNLSVGVAGNSLDALASFLPRVISGIQVQDLSSAESGRLDAVVFDAATAPEIWEIAPALLNEGALLLACGPIEGVDAIEHAGLELVAAEWSTRVYRARVQPVG